MEPLYIKLLPFDIVSILALIVLLLPFASFLFLFFFAKKLPRKGDWLATSVMFAAFLLSLVIFFQTWPQVSHLARFKWFGLKTTYDASFTASVLIDNSSALMLVIVTFISFLVHLYSMEYMRRKRNYSRYYPYLGVFTFSMIGIVISDNLIITFMFWEMVGFSSYLLIGFWFEKDAAVRAAKKAFLFNRLGDIGFLTGIFFFYSEFGSFELTEVRAFIEGSNYHFEKDVWVTIAGLGIFAGCVGKSAQFPLQVWLPDAMEGPTPVSALIHAATMVAAGVYLIIKTSVFLNADVLMVIAFTGAITAFFGALPAMFQSDIKKVLAYSTISQLGYMIMAVGTGSFDGGMFHLVTHAFFKAGLFLAAGSVIHAMHHLKNEMSDDRVSNDLDVQDMYMMGGLRKKLPVTFYAYLICSLALIGIPLSSGFLSKEWILQGGLNFAEKNGGVFWIIPVLSFGAVLITAFYMTRQIWLIFFGEFRTGSNSVRAAEAFKNIHESPGFMTIPLIILSIFSLGVFFSLNPLNVSSSWILQGLQSQNHDSNLIVLITSIILSFSGIFIAFIIYSRRLSESTNGVKSILLNNYYLDKFYYLILYKAGLKMALVFQKTDVKVIDRFLHFTAIFNVVLAHIAAWTDKYIVDGFVNSLAYFSGKLGSIFRSLQTGKIQAYFFISFFVLIIFIFWVFNSI